MRRNPVPTFIALAGLSALADTAYAVAPPCATSDGSTQSTACGSYALAANTGGGNTALGFSALTSNSTGFANTASGDQALFSNTSAAYNTANGFHSLASSNANFNTATGAYSLATNSTGAGNTAIGSSAMTFNVSGSRNTGVGTFALNATTASDNTGIGYLSLASNTTGGGNTASGNYSLRANTLGSFNTASGMYALSHNSTGNYNSASGYLALNVNSTGIYNAAFGAAALQSSQTSNENTAMGTGALRFDTTGNRNSATGFTALYNNTTGSGNTAVGSGAGFALTSGSYNTYIGFGTAGRATDFFVTRIGVANPASTTFIAGIGNSAIAGGLPVVVNAATGQIGFAASSERYKTDIHSLGPVSGKLAQLRPVSFHLKTDPDSAIQYGLIAEEVDKVYPELVIRDARGNIQGVRYDELAPMLVKEMQKEQATIAAQAEHSSAQDAEIRDLKQLIAKVEDLEHQVAGLHAQIQESQSKDPVVARR